MWPRLLAHAVRIGIAPAEFWALSVREWRWLTRAPGQNAPMARSDLEALSELFPDHGEPEHRGKE